jgi:hypothetical protein
MPEEEIETQELKERLEEAHEHAEHAGHGHGGTAWLTWLSLSTAIVAVLAAIAALESGARANDAIVQKNDAILHQSKADDAWSYYQAKSIQATVYAVQAEALAGTNGELAAKLRGEGDHERDDRTEIRKKAEEEEKIVAERNEESEHSLHVHHQFAKSVTIFQVAIALAAIAALTRRKAMWWVSMGIGAVGVGFFVMGLLAGG